MSRGSRKSSVHLRSFEQNPNSRDVAFTVYHYNICMVRAGCMSSGSRETSVNLWSLELGPKIDRVTFTVYHYVICMIRAGAYILLLLRTID